MSPSGSEVGTFARSVGTGALAGFLKTASNGSANLVNAVQLAADHRVTLEVCLELLFRRWFVYSRSYLVVITY